MKSLKCTLKYIYKFLLLFKITCLEKKNNNNRDYYPHLICIIF